MLLNFLINLHYLFLYSLVPELNILYYNSRLIYRIIFIIFDKPLNIPLQFVIWLFHIRVILLISFSKLYTYTSVLFWEILLTNILSMVFKLHIFCFPFPFIVNSIFEVELKFSSFDIFIIKNIIIRYINILFLYNNI